MSASATEQPTGPADGPGQPGQPGQPGRPGRPGPGATLRELAAAPALLPLLGWSLLARLHLSASVIALLVVAADLTGSYATAGLVTGALVLGQGITGPLRGRAVDRRPAARLLVWTSLLYGAGLGALAAVPASAGWQTLAGAAFLVGLACPPSTQVSRCKVAQLTEGPLRQRAYTLQATVNEIVLVLGPGVVSLALAAFGARGAVAVCGVLAVLGGLGLAHAVRRAGVDSPDSPACPPPSAPIPPSAPRASGTPGPQDSSLLRNRPALRAIAAVTALIAAFSVIDFILVSWAHSRGTPALGGLLTGVWAAGSAVGGLAATVGLTGTAVLRRRLALVALGVALLLPALSERLGAGTPTTVCLALALGGTVIPPALAALYDSVAELAGGARRGEAFGWIASLTTAAAAMVSPLAGMVLDRWGAVAATGLALAACAAALALAPARLSASKATP
ncbi:MFS transporter [Streptomyces sp. N2-109]|uniref:MFS transporter n=1 Tax=Streptomyces gossypii TaxID=2883101 RepID=A0ABT2JNC6_9ACTN|nr:MFS transporter [Streptomyces gossypii]MCT2589380.1 MFS transporter [Streptomyces gossypii]